MGTTTLSQSPRASSRVLIMASLSDRIGGENRRLFGCQWSAGNRFSHIGVGLHVAQFVIVHDSQLPIAKCRGDGLGNLSFRVHDAGPALLDLRDHLLFL